MGISDGYYSNDGSKTLQRTVNHYNTNKTNYGINLLPLENELISTSYNNKIPVLKQKGQLASSLINDMPTYEEIGFDSPTVKQTQGYLDNLTNLNYDDQFENELNDSASGGEFGSSYQASRRASLQDSKAKALNQNAISALSTGQSIYSNNLSNAENLMNFYLNGDTIPSLGSSMNGGLLSSGSSGSNNSNLATTALLSTLLKGSGTGSSSTKSKTQSGSSGSTGTLNADNLMFLPGESGTVSNNDYSNIASLASSPETGYALSGSGSSDSGSMPWGTIASTALQILPYLFG